MQKIIICKKLKARLKCIKLSSKKSYNWLFLPGGPGLGSESLVGLTNNLFLPGSMWFLDLPGDGSNIIINDEYYFRNWHNALIEAVELLENVILVAHSTGAMYALATFELKKIISGFVIMNSAVNASWQDYFMEYMKKNPLTEVERLQKVFINQPNNENLKLLTVASIPYLFSSNDYKKYIPFFESLPYNCRANLWSANNFDQTYSAKWVPDNIPTLIFAGDQDHLTPIKFFYDAKEFHHENINITTITNSGHFPWLENPNEVKFVFEEYCHRLQLK